MHLVSIILFNLFSIVPSYVSFRLLGVRTTAAIKTDPDKQQLEGDSEEAMLDGFQPSYVVEDAEDNYV